MGKLLTKNIYRAVIIASFLGINALIILGISSVISFLNSGADRTSMLHLDSEIESIYTPSINWIPGPVEGRPMEISTLEAITKDYKSAWYARNRAYEYNDPALLKEYYTDSVLVKLHKSLQFNKSRNISIKQTTLAHSPVIDFYSTDGKLVVFTDRNVTEYKEIFLREELMHQYRDTSTYKVILLQEDGFWRIRHMMRIEPSRIKETMYSTYKDHKVEVLGIKGVNYYPKNRAWAMFGTDFNGQLIRSDMNSISSMGLNTIRIFIPYSEFGASEVKSVYLNQLKKLLDIAGESGIKVMITLFDFYGNYDISDWTRNLRHAEQIVMAFKDHPALFGWDIKNEPDLDFENRGKNKVLAWLKEISSSIRSWDTNHPITIGWSNPKVATELIEEVDFISFHYYDSAENFKDAFDQLVLESQGKAVLLQEYGYSSYSGVWNLYTGSEKRQASYFKEMQRTLNEEHIPYMFWTLYDVDSIPSKVVGELPWRKARQKHFGCFDIEGTPKASFKFLNQK